MFIPLWYVIFVVKSKIRFKDGWKPRGRSVYEVVCKFKIICFWPGKFLESNHVCWFCCFILTLFKKNIKCRCKGWEGMYRWFPNKGHIIYKNGWHIPGLKNLKWCSIVGSKFLFILKCHIKVQNWRFEI